MLVGAYFSALHYNVFVMGKSRKPVGRMIPLANGLIAAAKFMTCFVRHDDWTPTINAHQLLQSVLLFCVFTLCISPALVLGAS